MTIQEFSNAKVGDRVRMPFGVRTIRQVVDHRGQRMQLWLDQEFLPIDTVGLRTKFDRFELVEAA